MAGGWWTSLEISMEGESQRQNIVNFQSGAGQGEGFHAVWHHRATLLGGQIRWNLSNFCGWVLLTKQMLNSQETWEELIQTEHFVVPVIGISVVVQLLLMTWFPLWFHSRNRMQQSWQHIASHIMTVIILLVNQPLPPALVWCALMIDSGPSEYNDCGRALSCLELCSFIPVSWDCFKSLLTRAFYIFESNGSFAGLTLSLVSSQGSCTIRIRKFSADPGPQPWLVNEGYRRLATCLESVRPGAICNGVVLAWALDLHLAPVMAVVLGKSFNLSDTR